MTFIDLKRRLSARREAPKAADLPLEQMAAPVLATPVAVQAAPPEEPATPLVAPIIKWDNAVLTALANALPLGQDVLLAGLGPWGRDGARGLPEALSGRARALVAFDPEKPRLNQVRGYCQRILEIALDDPELFRRAAGQRFGAIIATDALVGVPDPVTFLRGLRGLLQPGGQLLIAVPNEAHADARLALLAGELPRGFEQGAPRHRYTRQQLTELLAFAGYQVEEAIAVAKPVLATESTLVPELFPPAVLAALGPQEDAQAGYYVLRATPASADTLLRGLFDEAIGLKRAVRNELATALVKTEDLAQRLALKEAEYTEAATALEAANRKQVALDDMANRAEHNIRRLGKEVDDAQRELVTLRGTFWFKLGQLFGRLPASRSLEFAANEPELWKWAPEPKSRYLA